MWRGLLKTSKQALEATCFFRQGSLRTCTSSGPYSGSDYSYSDDEEPDAHDMRNFLSAAKISVPSKPIVQHHIEKQTERLKTAEQSEFADLDKAELHTRNTHFKSDLSQRLIQLSETSAERETYQRKSFKLEESQDNEWEEPRGESQRDRMRRSMAESRRESRQTNRRKPPFDKGTYDYNHGLPGVGNKPWRLGNRKTEITLPDVQGEVLFGLYPVLLAIQEGRRYLNRVFVKKGAGQETLMKAILKAAAVKGVEVHECEAAELDFLSKNRQHQGVCLDASQLVLQSVDEVADVDSSEEPRLWVILDRIQDPMNFGAVLRSCYYLGVHRVITSSKEGCALSPVVCKASAGALELAPLFKTSNLTDFVQAWREKGFRILGTGMPTEGEACSSPVIPLNTIDMQQDTILIFGNEGKGMDTELISLCDALLTISPRKALHQSLDSLNVSVAAGIVLHHLLNTKCTQL